MHELSESVRLLVAMADAFAEPAPNTGTRQPLLFFKYLGGQGLQHHAFDGAQWSAIDEEMLDRLAAQGLIRLGYGRDSTVSIFVTQSGEQVASEARRVLEGDPDEDVEAVSLDWDEVARPVLDATYKAWISRGAPAKGVLTSTVAPAAIGADNELQAYRALELLVDGGYLERVGSLATEYGPMAVTVTARGLQVVGGWPATTGEAAAGALLAALDRAIDDADEPERRNKLQRLREVAMDLGQGALAEVLKHVVTSGI